MNMFSDGYTTLKLVDSRSDKDGITAEVVLCRYGYAYRFTSVPDCDQRLCLVCSLHEQIEEDPPVTNLVRNRRHANDHTHSSSPTSYASTSSSYTTPPQSTTEAQNRTIEPRKLTTDKNATTSFTTEQNATSSYTTEYNVTSPFTTQQNATSSQTLTSVTTSFTTEARNQTDSQNITSSFTTEQNATSSFTTEQNATSSFTTQQNATSSQTPTSVTTSFTTEARNQTDPQNITSSPMTTSQTEKPTSTATPTSVTSSFTTEGRNQTDLQNITSSPITTSQTDEPTSTATPTSVTSSYTTEQNEKSSFTTQQNATSSFTTQQNATSSQTPTSVTTSFTTEARNQTDPQNITSSFITTSPFTTEQNATSSQTPTSVTSSFTTEARNQTDPQNITSSPITTSQTDEPTSTATPTSVTSSFTTEQSTTSSFTTQQNATSPFTTEQNATSSQTPTSVTTSFTTEAKNQTDSQNITSSFTTEQNATSSFTTQQNATSSQTPTSVTSSFTTEARNQTDPQNITSSSMTTESFTTEQNATSSATPTSVTSSFTTEQNATSSFTTEQNATSSFTTQQNATSSQTPTSITSSFTTEARNQTDPQNITSSPITTSQTDEPTSTATPTSVTSSFTTEGRNQTDPQNITSSPITTSQTEKPTSTATPTSATSSFTTEVRTDSQNTTSSSMTSSSFTTEQNTTSSFTTQQNATSSATPTSVTSSFTTEARNKTDPQNITSSFTTEQNATSSPITTSQTENPTSTATPTSATSSFTTEVRTDPQNITSASMTSSSFTTEQNTTSSFTTQQNATSSATPTSVTSSFTTEAKNKTDSQNITSSFTTEQNATSSPMTTSQTEKPTSTATPTSATSSFTTEAKNRTDPQNITTSMTTSAFTTEPNATSTATPTSATSSFTTEARNETDPQNITSSFTERTSSPTTESSTTSRTAATSSSVTTSYVTEEDQEITEEPTYAPTETEVMMVEDGSMINVTCYTEDESDSMVYQMDGTTIADPSVVVIGLVQHDGRNFTQIEWEVGPLGPVGRGRYRHTFTCTSYRSDEIRYEMTTLVGVYTLNPAKPIVVSESYTADVGCVYNGPTPDTLTWYWEGYQIGDIEELSGGDGQRRDNVTINHLTTDTEIDLVVCIYYFAKYNTTLNTTAYLTYAALPSLPGTTEYTSDNVNLTCSYMGSDAVTITWYGLSGILIADENTTIISNTDKTEAYQIVMLENHGFQGGSYTCQVALDGYDFAKNVSTTLHRAGFIQALPSLILRDPGSVNLVCIWGSSDMPENAKWLVVRDLNPDDVIKSRGSEVVPRSWGLFPETTMLSDYVMQSSLESNLSKLFQFSAIPCRANALTTVLALKFERNENGSGQCSDRRYRYVRYYENSTAIVYGVVVTAESGTVGVHAGSNSTYCTVNYPPSAMWWEYNGTRIYSNDTKYNIVQTDNTTISIEFGDVSSAQSGVYVCYAEVLGQVFNTSLTVEHISVEILGGPVQVVMTPTYTLTCNVDSSVDITTYKWLINGRTVNPTPELIYEVDIEFIAGVLGPKLEFTCTVKTPDHGWVDDSVSLLVRIPTMSNLVSVSSEWTLTCEVLSDRDDFSVTWSWDGAGAVPGVQKTDSDGNHVIVATDSTWVDDGVYTCTLEYPDHGGTSNTSASVQVRVTYSDIPTVYYSEFTPTTLWCKVESEETPTSGEWTLPSGTVTETDLLDLGDNTWGVNYTTSAQGDSDFTSEPGVYECTFSYSDTYDPTLSMVLMYGHVAITSPSPMLLVDGSTLTLEANLYSSNWQGYTLGWFKDGKLLSTTDGWVEGISRTSKHNYTISISKEDASSEDNGEYTVTFTAKGYVATLTSEGVDVEVIQSGETVTVTSSGGAQNLTCSFAGTSEPLDVVWLLNSSPINTTKWNVTETSWTGSSMSSQISTESLLPSDDGTYECVYMLGSVNVTKGYEVTVRILEMEVSGTIVIRTEDWSTTVMVKSMEQPRSNYLLRGSSRIYNYITGPEQQGDFTWVYSLKDSSNGANDGTYEIVFKFSDNTFLTSGFVTVATRIVSSSVDERQTITVDGDGSASSSLYLDCSYTGGASPTNAYWTKGDGVKIAPTKSKSSGGKYTQYKMSLSKSSDITIDDGATYTCMFIFSDGISGNLTLPHVSVGQSTGTGACSLISALESADITCSYETRETLTAVSWEYQDGTTVATNATGPATAEVSHGGRYYCYGDTTLGEQFSTYTDVTLATVTLAQEPENVYTGSLVTVTCEPEGIYVPVTMLHNGSQVKAKDRNGVYTTTFTLNSDTAGNYSCEAYVKSCGTVQTVHGITADGDTVIELKDSLAGVIMHPANMTVTQGDTAVMTCIFPVISDSNPAQVLWQREGYRGYKYGRKVWNDTMVVATYTIKEVEASDEMRYRCIAKYSTEWLNTDWGSIVMAGFSSSDVVDQMTAIEGNNATFSCSYSGGSDVSVTLDTDSEADLSGVSHTVSQTVSDTGLVVHSYNFTITDLTEDHEGDYWCVVGGVTSSETDLEVVTIQSQPQNVTVTVGDNAAFTFTTSKFKWQDYVAEWQSYNATSGEWETAVESATISIADYTAGKWKSFINIYDVSASTPTLWRARTTFPQHLDSGFMYGQLVSDVAEIHLYGTGTISLDTGDDFEGSTLNLTLSVHLHSDPSIRIYLGSYRADYSYWRDDITTSFNAEQEKFTMTVLTEMKSWFAGVTITVKIPSYDLDWSVSFPDTVYQRCTGLSTPDNGALEYSESATGQTVTLSCDEENSYYPYEADKAYVYCDYLTGYWNETMTTCAKRISIDYSVLKIGLFFTGYTGCKPSRYQAYFINILNTLGKTCGWSGTQMNILCYHDDPQMCNFNTTLTSCDYGWASLSTGATKKGSKMMGYFKYTGEIDFTSGSDYMTYAEDVADGGNRYVAGGSSFRSGFFVCSDPSKRRRRREASVEEFEEELQKLIDWNDTLVEIEQYPDIDWDNILEDGKGVVTDDFVPDYGDDDDQNGVDPSGDGDGSGDVSGDGDNSGVISENEVPLEGDSVTHDSDAGSSPPSDNQLPLPPILTEPPASPSTNFLQDKEITAIIIIASLSIVGVGVLFSWYVLKDRGTRPVSRAEIETAEPELTLINFGKRMCRSVLQLVGGIISTLFISRAGPLCSRNRPNQEILFPDWLITMVT
eukprot:sb/3460369/